MNNKLYKNLLLAKEELNSIIENKVGVYQLVNLINGKTYVGSSVNLKRRLIEYLNPLYINRNLAKGNSKILNALLKYGFINFGIRILEFIEFETKQTKSEVKNILLPLLLTARAKGKRAIFYKFN